MNSLAIVVRCAVCGDEAAAGADVLRCERCEAPHHRECWFYNAGCAIYGCTLRPAAPRPCAPPRLVPFLPDCEPKWSALPDQALEPQQASLFGALTGGTAVMATIAAFHSAAVFDAMTHLHRHVSRDFAPLYLWAIPAVILGAVAGPALAHRRKIGSILFYGILGPGITMCALSFPLLLTLVWGPCVMLYSLVTVPLSLPCAFLTACFNDPRLANPARQRTWLVNALLAAAATVVLAMVLFTMA